MTSPRIGTNEQRGADPAARREVERDSGRDLGSGRVALVVDDEATIRTLVSTVLRRRGWSVLEAEDGCTALDMAPDRLDLLVTDYEMPRLTGIALATRLRLRDGELAVLMVSGHVDVEARLADLRWPRTAFVGKPFGVEALISTIGSITH